MNRRFSLCVAVSFSVFALLWGCSDDKVVNGDDDDTVLMPLKIGNSWTYYKEEFDSAGTILDTATFFRSISIDTVVQGIRWYGLNASWYAHRPYGLWRCHILSSFEERYYWYYLYPASAGSSSHFSSFFSDSAGCEIKVADTKHALTSPAGLFICYTYVVDLSCMAGSVSDSIIEFFSPRVGMIGLEAYQSTPSGYAYVWFRLTLQSYELK